jgi:hypothetical protein
VAIVSSVAVTAACSNGDDEGERAKEQARRSHHESTLAVPRQSVSLLSARLRRLGVKKHCSFTVSHASGAALYAKRGPAFSGASTDASRLRASGAYRASPPGQVRC